MPTLYAMPFGKHKGKPLHRLPDGYLRWLLTIDIDDALLRAATKALTGEPVYGPSDNDKVDAARDACLARLRAEGRDNG